MAIACSSTRTSMLGLLTLTAFAVAEPSSSPCAVRSTKYLPVMNNVSSTKQPDAKACQISCSLTPGCEHFSFFSDTLECTYAGPAAKGEADYRASSGPSSCPPSPKQKQGPCYTEVAQNGFPGLNAEGTNSAWASGKQPSKLQCWPKDEVSGQPLACKDVAVIEDSNFGWPGACMGLYHQANLGETCEMHCKNVPTCQGWQLAPDQSCWEGMGDSCYVRPGFVPIRSQRFQHGNVRVLMNLEGWQVFGLHRVFDAKGDGYFTSDAEAISHCKLACYSDIKCDFWSYSYWYGCWVEDVNFATVEYPLTLNSMTRDSDYAKSAVAGEYIQHSCDVTAAEALDAQTTPPPAPFCTLHGYKMDPLDMPGSVKVVQPNALKCQEQCSMTDGCAYFTFWEDDGSCHMSDANSVLLQAEEHLAVRAGPASCPRTTPAPFAQCDLHPACSNHTGFCCPNLDGYKMDCCDMEVVAGAGSVFGMSVPQRAADFGLVGVSATDTEDESSSNLFWVLLVALAVVLCGCCLIAGALSSRNSKSRAIKITDTASGAFVTQDHMESLTTDMEAPEEDSLMSNVDEKPLPFPDAGLPNGTLLPFPEVGLPLVHGHPQYHS